MRKDGYNDGGHEPLVPIGRNFKLAIKLISELDCECEPSETTCDRCAALSDLWQAEKRVVELEDALRKCKEVFP